ncbi:unnamed protein product [Ambrosiozyma monospora]|uniref:Unnamed protein product n=1 Tax=Ambrosiozyma monospora TaxID=43982 RepID=A0A9W6YR36_AMBMO|nr:unnamed protein product [Ambrosiozyma monospora]
MDIDEEGELSIRGTSNNDNNCTVFTQDEPNIDDFSENFYLRVYTGGIRSRDIGQEFIEYDVRYNANEKSGVLRYANQSNYRDEELIKKEVGLSLVVITELKKLIKQSEILLETDEKWPESTRESKQELEIRLGKKVKKLNTLKMASVVETKFTDDPEGLKVYYYFLQNLRALVFSLISLHFKVKPVQR